MEQVTLKSKQMTSINQWKIIGTYLEDIKRNIKDKEHTRKLDQIYDLFGNHFSNREPNEFYQGEIARQFYSYISKPHNIEKMSKLFETLDYLDVKSILFDLIPEKDGSFAYSDGMFLNQLFNYQDQENKQILKLYTDGEFLLKPVALVNGRQMTEIRTLKNNTWTILTSQREQHDEFVLDDRIAILHTFSPDRTTFPSKKELDSMKNSNMMSSRTGEWGIKPWGYQPYYKERYEELGLSAFVKKKR